MTNPFPGIDPYLEDQGLWPDFHTSFLVCCRRELLRLLPRRYDARIEERLTVVAPSGDATGVRADVIVTSRPGASMARAAVGGAASASASASVLVPLAGIEEDAAVIERRIEVRRQPDRSLVAVVELLSPSNKVEPGFSEYARKRQELIRRPVHLIELDFLARGRRLPMGGPLPAGDVYALVSRVEVRPDCEVYARSIREPLPTIAVPLDAPDPDLPLDLGAVYASAHEEGDYGRTVDRLRPLALPLRPDHLAWAESVARASESP